MRTLPSSSSLALLALSLALVACEPASAPDPEARAIEEAVDAHLVRASEALDAEEFAVAAVALSAATELAPRSPRVQRARMVAELRQAAARPAVITPEATPRLLYATRALADDEALAAPRLIVEARLALAAGAVDEAGARADEAVAADGGARALLARADVLDARGDADGATAALDAAAQAAPTSSDVLERVGAAHLDRGRAEAARSVLVRALEQRDRASTRTHLADALLRLGRLDEAAAQLERAIAVAPEDPRPLRLLGALLKKRGAKEEAASALTRALELAPDDAWTTFTLGVLEQELEHHPKAVRRFREALALDPSAYAPAYHLAISLQKMGDKAGAAEALRRYVAASAGVPVEASRRAEAQRLLSGGGGSSPSP